MASSEVSVGKDRIEFRFSGIAANANEVDLKARAEAVLPLLQSLLAADGVFNAASPADQQDRMQGYLALNMRCQALIESARREADKLQALADGTAQPGELGFPEFDPKALAAE